VPETTVFFFQDDDGTVPVKVWLEQLQRKYRQAFAQCVAVIRRLALFGYDLHRPSADFLRDGIHELRARKGRINYRVLYFFHGKNALTKEDKVPNADINRAVERKKRYEQNPKRHTHEESFDEEA
jgi:hypothetical protein